MNVIQGGPKPVVAVPTDTLGQAQASQQSVSAVPVKAAGKGEQPTSHYARDGNRDANVDDVRGRRVNVEA
jgi:hypothetical protein